MGKMSDQEEMYAEGQTNYVKDGITTDGLQKIYVIKLSCHYATWFLSLGMVLQGNNWPSSYIDWNWE